jgi:hypothetical protein
MIRSRMRASPMAHGGRSDAGLGGVVSLEQFQRQVAKNETVCHA